MVEVAVTDKREQMANQLLMRGHATMRELLEMSFGEWPVKGLNIDPGISHDQKVMLKLKHGKIRDELGYVYHRSARRRIFYTNSSLEKNKANQATLPEIIGHEAVHVLQSEKTHWKSKYFIIGAMMDFHVYLSIYQYFKKTQAEKIAQKFLNEEYSYLRSEFGEEKTSKLKYLNQAIEIQARLHEIIADGYQYWGKLPQTSQEFIDALIGVDAINADISISSPNSSSIFLTKVPARIDAVSDIAHLMKDIYFSRTNKGEFINNVLPALYVNLLELYGDKNARQRFGLDENYKPLSQAARQTIFATPTPSPA